jgi:tRNA (cmo5U34)-methyltransferase
LATNPSQNHWSEDTSKNYLDYGKYFVPERETLMQIIIDLLEGIPQPGLILELCCGEGLLAEMLLAAYPGIHYRGLDGSLLMLEAANKRLSRFNDRIRLESFELADHSWRKPEQFPAAVVSMLAIHHLDGIEKKVLFQDVYTMLAQGGTFIVADMVQPATTSSCLVAAEAWDEVVRQRSLQLDGNLHALDFFLNEHWNIFRYPDPDDIDHPSTLFEQLKWLEEAGFQGIDVHYFQAGHALFSGWKQTH